MSAREPVTEVIFRRWPKSQGSDVIAMFPLIPETNVGTCSSYAHIGQHGACSLDISGWTRAAHVGEADVDALVHELEGRGYVLKRLPNWRRIARSRKEAGL